MGNTSSSGRAHQEETVDFGYLTPQGVYTGPRDWNHTIVTQLIVDRKLAPFYRPLEDYEEDWDDEQILAHMKEPQPQEGTEGEGNGTRADAASIVSSSSRTHHKRPSGSAREAPREQPKHPELGIYRGATDCPICFLVCYVQSRTLHPFSCTTQVLPLKHQPLSVLRPSHLHRMLRSDQARRPDNHPPRLGTRLMSLLRTRKLWSRLHTPVLESGHRQRRLGQSSIFIATFQSSDIRNSSNWLLTCRARVSLRSPLSPYAASPTAV